MHPTLHAPQSAARLAIIGAIFVSASSAWADPPSTAYIFPAGGQRGTTVAFRIGGHYLHEGCPFEMDGPGVDASPRVERTETLWFEGPVIPLPDSQRREEYPKDYAGRVTIAGDAPLGTRRWRVSTSQGVTPSLPFVIGDLPEVIENEIEGEPVPVLVELPVTVNGRIFPREDVDVWTFDAAAGQTITCEVTAARIGSELDARLEVRDPAGRRIAESIDTLGRDPRLRFTAPVDGRYAVHIHDVNFGGLQHYVYRLTITAGPWIDHVYPLGGRRGSTLQLELAGANLPANSATVTLPDKSEADLFHYTLLGNKLFQNREGEAPAEPVHAQNGSAGASPSHRLRRRYGSETASKGESNLVPLELDDLPEYLEDDSADKQPVSLPAVLNGRILRPGEVDLWTFEATQGGQYLFDLRAARLGSPLDSVLTLLDAEGKQLAQSDDIGNGQTDSRLDFTVPADGTYTVRVEDRFASRGGPEYAYRLRITAAAGPDFRLVLPTDAVSLPRGGNVTLDLTVERHGYQDEIELEFDSLPEGVTANPTTVGKNQPRVRITLEAAESASVQTVRLALKGRGKREEDEIVRRAVILAETRGLTPPARQEELRLAVAVPTPFKFFGAFETKFAPRGSVHRRKYQLERGGFEGPIEVSLADRQARHLQGVTGRTIIVPPGATEFEYSVTLAPWMEVGRTSRTCLMAVGVVEEPDGSLHKVSYSSEAQNDQIIVLVDPGRLSVSARRGSIAVHEGPQVAVPVEVGRGVGLSGPVTVTLEVPGHMSGIEADPLTLPADATTADFVLRFTDDASGPFNQPLTLRATMTDERGDPVIAETALTVVPAESEAVGNP